MKGENGLKKLYQAPQMEELLFRADEAINAISESQYNNGEFGEDTWS